MFGLEPVMQVAQGGLRAREVGSRAAEVYPI